MIGTLLLLVLALLGSASAGFFSRKNILIRSFRFTKCPTHTGVVEVRDLHISTTAEGDLLVSGAVSTAVNITSPIEAKLKLYRVLAGLSVPIPCIMQIGSCHYDDLCEFGMPPDLPCQGALEENDIPCRCPIAEGLYTLPGAQFPIPPTRLSGILAGHYRGTVRLGPKQRPLACYRFTGELQ